MRNVIIKTALITLAAIVAMVLTIYLCMLAFAPKALSKTYSRLGWNNAALKLAERVYDKDDSADNLIYVFQLADIAENDDKIIEYGKEIIDKADNIEISLTENDYIYYAGEVACSMAGKNLYNEAIDYALAHCKDYGKGNPLKKLILFALTNEDKEVQEKLKSALEKYKSENENLTDEVKNILQEYIDFLND